MLQLFCSSGMHACLAQIGLYTAEWRSMTRRHPAGPSICPPTTTSGDACRPPVTFPSPCHPATAGTVKGVGEQLLNHIRRVLKSSCAPSEVFLKDRCRCVQVFCMKTPDYYIICEKRLVGGYRGREDDFGFLVFQVWCARCIAHKTVLLMPHSIK